MSETNVRITAITTRSRGWGDGPNVCSNMCVTGVCVC